MAKRDSGFSLFELLIVIFVTAIIIAFAVPQAYQAIKGYKLHSDTMAVSQQLNMARFRATAQFTPYRLDLDTTTNPNSFYLERLCGTSTSGCTTPSGSCIASYAPLTTPIYDFGVQYLSASDAILTSMPSAITANPGTVTGGAPASTIYFNTRGMPVNCDGTPVSNGGQYVLVTNGTLTDAVAVSVAGRITIYSWVPASGSTPASWYTR